MNAKDCPKCGERKTVTRYKDMHGFGWSCMICAFDCDEYNLDESGGFSRVWPAPLSDPFPGTRVVPHKYDKTSK